MASLEDQVGVVGMTSAEDEMVVVAVNGSSVALEKPVFDLAEWQYHHAQIAFAVGRMQFAGQCSLAVAKEIQPDVVVSEDRDQEGTELVSAFETLGSYLAVPVVVGTPLLE